MNIYKLKTLLLAFFSFAGSFGFAQKIAKIQIISLIDQIPLPESCSTSYSGSTILTDSVTGRVTFKDKGPRFNQIDKELQQMMDADVDAMHKNTAQAANQVAAQQAAQEAAQAQAAQAQAAQQQAAQMANMTPDQIQQMMQKNNSTNTSAPQKVDGKMMKEIGLAQTAAQKIEMIVMEINSKVGGLPHTDRSKLPVPASCPEVMQGSYAGPTCGCEKGRSVKSEYSVVEAENQDISSLIPFIAQYAPRIKEQVIIVDQLESDYKYGDAVTDPNMKRVFLIVQRQAMSGFASLYGLSGIGWEQGAKTYVDYINATKIKCKD
jgi:hypothetical protein